MGKDFQLKLCCSDRWTEELQETGPEQKMASWVVQNHFKQFDKKKQAAKLSTVPHAWKSAQASTLCMWFMCKLFETTRQPKLMFWTTLLMPCHVLEVQIVTKHLMSSCFSPSASSEPRQLPNAGSGLPPPLIETFSHRPQLLFGVWSRAEV